MPAPFPAAVGDKVTEIASTTDSATGLVDAQIDLNELLAGPMNAFGEAALEDTGTNAGDLPLLVAGGVLDNERLPAHIDRTSLRVDAPGPGIVADGLDADSRYAVNMRVLLMALGWLTHPDRDVYRDEAQNAGGVLTTSAGITINVDDDLRSYYQWRIRYDPPGAAGIQTVTVDNAIGTTTWLDVNPGRAGDTLQYRQQSGSQNVRRLELRSDNPSYRILSVRGINSSIPNADTRFTSRFPSEAEITAKATRWGRGYLIVSNRTTTLTEAQLRDNGYILLSGSTWVSGDIVSVPVTIRGGLWIFQNATNATINLAPSTHRAFPADFGRWTNMRAGTTWLVRVNDAPSVNGFELTRSGSADYWHNQNYSTTAFQPTIAAANLRDHEGITLRGVPSPTGQNRLFLGIDGGWDVVSFLNRPVTVFSAPFDASGARVVLQPNERARIGRIGNGVFRLAPLPDIRINGVRQANAFATDFKT